MLLLKASAICGKGNEGKRNKSVTNIKITSSNGNVQISGISDDTGKSKLQDLLEDLDKPQSGDSYNVDIENGRKVTVSIV